MEPAVLLFQNVWMYMSSLLVVMAATGVFGGVVNYFRTSKSEREDTSLRKCIFLGLGASGLVPLFLNMISSDLLATIPKEPVKLLVFAGFCLIAAISSTVFIRKIEEQILKEATTAKQKAEAATEQAQAARQEATEAKKTVGILMEAESEPEKVEAGTLPRRAAGEGLAGSEGEVTALLRALVNSPYRFRYLDGLAKDSQLDKTKVNDLLSRLIEEGLVGQSDSSRGPRWFITGEGRKMLLSLGG